MKNNPKSLLIAVVLIVPAVCLGLGLVGMAGFWITSSFSSAGSARASGLSEAEIEAEVLGIATDFARDGDLETARQRLTALDLPNAEQYVSFMVDRYIQEDQGIESADTQNLFLLADALGTSTESMIAALSTPTPVPTPTVPPTATPLPPTPTPSPTPMPSVTVTPTDPPEATDTPELPTPTPGPPTDTPEPTATPEPTKPPVDFVVAEAYLIPNPSYNTCPGAHSINVTVVDANGNPLDGVMVEDTHRVVPPHLSGEKGPGKLEYDLWNNGFSLQVTKKMDGSPATSEVTPKLSSVDEDIPNEWLIEANYCKDMNDCLSRKSSNQLCRGHYAYNVTFKRTY